MHVSSGFHSGSAQDQCTVLTSNRRSKSFSVTKLTFQLVHYLTLSCRYRMVRYLFSASGSS
jgi:hypothetical protein